MATFMGDAFNFVNVTFVIVISVLGHISSCNTPSIMLSSFSSIAIGWPTSASITPNKDRCWWGTFFFRPFSRPPASKDGERCMLSRREGADKALSKTVVVEQGKEYVVHQCVRASTIHTGEIKTASPSNIPIQTRTSRLAEPRRATCTVVKTKRLQKNRRSCARFFLIFLGTIVTCLSPACPAVSLCIITDYYRNSIASRICPSSTQTRHHLIFDHVMFFTRPLP